MKICWLCLTAAFISNIAMPQKNSLSIKPDNLKKITDTANDKINTINSKAYTENTRITFQDYFILLGSDFKQDVTAPFKLTRKQLLHTGIYMGTLIALQSASESFDEPIQRLAVSVHNSSNTVAGISSYITNFGGRYELYSLLGLGGYGFIFNNRKMQTTTLLATQAYITSGLLETVIKTIAGRQRPSYYNPNHPEAEPDFHGPFLKKSFNVSGHASNSSFPSGHTTVIFAAATVFAKEYKNISWVPVAAYSAATLVGLSRLTENKHWATDVIAGATLGILCGNEVVNNYHRFASIKSPRKSGTLSFNLQYNGYNVEPGFVYTFKR